MAASASPPLYEGAFRVTDVDPEGKKFATVARLVAKHEKEAHELQIDVHRTLCPLRVGHHFHLTLAKAIPTSAPPGDTGASAAAPAGSGFPLVPYVMHGQVFKKSTDDKQVFASYGGLLMSLKTTGADKPFAAIADSTSLFCTLVASS